MGLPQIQIDFTSKATTAIKRSAMGVVALILRDTKKPTGIYTIQSVEEVKTDEWANVNNVKYIQHVLLGTPSKVIVVVTDAATAVNAVLAQLANVKFNYLAMPGAVEEATQDGKKEVTAIVTWVKEKRKNQRKTFKAVVADNAADDEGIINFTTKGIKVKDEAFTPQAFTARIAGALAGLPFSRSSTYLILPEVTEITDHATPDADIEAGQLILINDGENIKIGRGVNSLTTLTGGKSEEFKKIKVVEIMDMIKDDIRDTFDSEYIGKVLNTYDNQVLFFTSVNAYLKSLAADDILDPSFTNQINVDVEQQRLAWEGVGVDTSEWDDLKVKNMAFRSNVFAAGNIKIVDAVEDLKLSIII